MSVVLTKEYNVAANSEELIAAKEYLTLQARCRVIQFRHNRVQPYTFQIVWILFPQFLSGPLTMSWPTLAEKTAIWSMTLKPSPYKLQNEIQCNRNHPDFYSVYPQFESRYNDMKYASM
jgi:hypothetical protein